MEFEESCDHPNIGSRLSTVGNHVPWPRGLRFLGLLWPDGFQAVSRLEAYDGGHLRLHELRIECLSLLMERLAERY